MLQGCSSEFPVFFNPFFSSEGVSKMGVSLFSLCPPFSIQDLSQKYLSWLYHTFILRIVERSKLLCISRLDFAGACCKRTSLARLVNRFPRQRAQEHCTQRGYDSQQIIWNSIRISLEITALYHCYWYANTIPHSEVSRQVLRKLFAL